MTRKSVHMKKHITILPGDGIGLEITAQALKVLQALQETYSYQFDITTCLFGGAAVDKFGMPLPAETLMACRQADAVLLGAVGGPRWEHIDKNKRPEKGLLQLRKELGLFANIRPAAIFSELKDASPLRKDIVDQGIDFVIVRELTGGLYFGQHETLEQDGQHIAYDGLTYSEHEIRRILRVGFETARKRRQKLCLVDKANVLDSSKLWRKILQDLAPIYPEVQISAMYVDNAAMQIIKNPSQFDTIVTENMFGDILSDEASMITGSIGMIPSASMGAGTFGLYEPIHGSAPDIAGTNQANPIGMILSVAMMLRYSFNLPEAADAIQESVEQVLQEGYRTADLHTPETQHLSCSDMGDVITEKLCKSSM